MTDLAPTPPLSARHPHHAGVWGLALGSLGVVYGDIGTSPLYAFREAMAAANAQGTIARDDVIGVISLILWALVIIVTVKYVLLFLRADNQGEGGTLTLLALAQRALGGNGGWLIGFGMVGAGLFYGDAVITPAVSVLSAIEGMKLVTPSIEPFIVFIACIIIIALFVVQRHGTASVAKWFGPVMLAWFLAMAWGGLMHLATDLAMVAAFNPLNAIGFVAHHGHIGLVVLGAVFLSVTGAEALYADLGHFGRRPIQLAWTLVAFPALTLNYLGQGALVIANPKAIENPFFMLYPEWALFPMVLFATLATIIASQSVISGAYSLTRQAIQLKLLPRLKVAHTSESQAGQIYIPAVNALLLIGVLVLILGFESSSKLANAYGIAVTGTMVITAMLGFVVVRRVWGWSLPLTIAVVLPLLMLDLVFLGANLIKVLEGGYVPLGIALALIVLMATWRRGTVVLARKDQAMETPLADIIAIIEKKPPPTIPGTAVYLTPHPTLAPVALMHSLKHYKSLHEHNVILTIITADAPHIAEEQRVEMEQISPRFRRVTLRFGYMDEPNVPKALALCRKRGWTFDIMATSFLISRRALKLAAKSAMPRWQSLLFMFLSRNSTAASDYFRIPAGRVVEIGTQVNM